MSGLIVTAHDKFAPNVGSGVDNTKGTVVTANGTSGTPANILKMVEKVISAGHSAHGLSH
jgi:hypothetical protein